MNDAIPGIPYRPQNQHAVRRTITLPAALQKEMEAYPEINWSKVAADAFEVVLKLVRSEKK